VISDTIIIVIKLDKTVNIAGLLIYIGAAASGRL